MRGGECLACGVVFEKFKLPDDDAGRLPPTELLTASNKFASPLDRRIVGVTRVLRLLGGLLALALGFLLYMNGRALHAFELYMVLLVYVMLGVWILATARRRITIREFLVEMLFIAVATVPAYLLSPEILGIGEARSALSAIPPGARPVAARRGPGQAGPAASPASLEPDARMRAAVANYLRYLLQGIESGRSFPGEAKDLWVQAVSPEVLAPAWEALPATRKQEWASAWSDLRALGNEVAELVSTRWRRIEGGGWRLELSEVEQRRVREEAEVVGRSFGP